MNAKNANYSNIKSEKFDWTISPIAYIPNWNIPKYQNKILTFDQIATKDLVELPKYDVARLQNENNFLERYTYTVLYMGGYSLNYKENDGSHLGVDIRAVTGTPVRNIANGVVVKTNHGDSTGNKYITIRHDNVPVNWKNTTIYSNYLHLSEINVTEWSKIRKWEMIGKVGNTGISTAPHLHFQIDTEDAPFHPYWPFTMQEAKQNGMTIFQAVTAGLGNSNARKYTIHPMEFVQHYNSGKINNFAEKNPTETPKIKTLEEIANFTEFAETATTPPNIKLEDLVSFNETVVASQIFYNPEKNPNRGEALIAIMKHYNIAPKNGISDYLDISLSDSELQGYAIVASEMWIFQKNYLNPEKSLTKWEFIEILARFGKLAKAPKNHKSYNDINKNSTLYNSINNYGYTIGAKNQNINPNKTLTQADLVEILSKL